jgi:hypothetical protein
LGSLGSSIQARAVLTGTPMAWVALAAGIDRAYVGRVERGSQNVTISTLEAMARALSVPVAYLLV